jgi:DNA-binding phage protein
MGAAKQLDFKNHILDKAIALGNSNTSLLDIASSALKRLSDVELSRIAEDSDLNPQTFTRLKTMKESELGRRYNPSLDTIERTLKAFGVELNLKQILLDPKYKNKPKEKYL